jgi:hypothetical protein
MLFADAPSPNRRLLLMMAEIESCHVIPPSLTY